MTDDSIRSLLTTVTPTWFIWSPPGTVVLMDKDVAAAGGDSEAVGKWVEANGGEVERTLPVVSSSRRTMMVPKVMGKRYYVVPASILAD